MATSCCQALTSAFLGRIYSTKTHHAVHVYTPTRKTMSNMDAAFQKCQKIGTPVKTNLNLERFWWWEFSKDYKIIYEFFKKVLHNVAVVCPPVSLFLIWFCSRVRMNVGGLKRIKLLIMQKRPFFLVAMKLSRKPAGPQRSGHLRLNTAWGTDVNLSTFGTCDFLFHINTKSTRHRFQRTFIPSSAPPSSSKSPLVSTRGTLLLTGGSQLCSPAQDVA